MLQSSFLSTSPKALTSKHNTIFNENIGSAEVSAVLCERINNLNNFKSQVCLNGDGNENKECSQSTSPPPSQDALGRILTEVKEESCEVPQLQQIQTNTATRYREKEVETFQDNSLTRGKPEQSKVSQSFQTHTASRDSEVEKLQEKFAAVSFWDNFGKSATSKRWSSDVSVLCYPILKFNSKSKANKIFLNISACRIKKPWCELVNFPLQTLIYKPQAKHFWA